MHNIKRISRIIAVADMRQEGLELFKANCVSPIPAGTHGGCFGDQCYQVVGYRLFEPSYYVCDRHCNCSEINDLCEHLFAVEQYEGMMADKDMALFDALNDV